MCCATARKALPARQLRAGLRARVEQARWINALLDQGSALVLVAGPRREIIYANKRAAERFGLPAGRMRQPRSLRDVHLDEERFLAFGKLYRLLRTQGTVRTEWELRTVNDEPCWFDMHGSLLDPNAPKGKVIWTLIDVNARHKAEAELASTQQRLEAIIDHFPFGIVVTDGTRQHIVAANQVLTRMLRLPFTADTLVGGPIQALAQHLPASIAQAFQAAPPDALTRTEHALPDGRHLEMEPLPLSKGHQRLGQCWILHDITDYKNRESILQALALTDPLTGVSNRRAFIDRMEMELEHLRLGETGNAALVMLDIDHFKRVNDTYGHAAGDVVLKHLAATIAHELRKGDMLGRLGGEEFAVLLSGADPQAAMKRAEDLRTAMASQPAIVAGIGPVHFTASLGVCSLEHGMLSVEHCLERADVALYISKRTGRNKSTLWAPNLPHASRNAGCV